MSKLKRICNVLDVIVYFLGSASTGISTGATSAAGSSWGIELLGAMVELMISISL
jgi:hypothetical protein